MIKYENDDYTFWFKYRLDEEGNPIIPVNPTTAEEIVLFNLPKRPELPNLRLHIKPKTQKAQPVAWKSQSRRSSYEELAGETGPWSLARKAMEEINEIVEATYPGYGIINL